MTTLYRSAHQVRRILRGLSLFFLGEVTVHAAREQAAEYGWRVVALVMLMLFVAAYCFYMAFTAPTTKTWGHS